MSYALYRMKRKYTLRFLIHLKRRYHFGDQGHVMQQFVVQTATAYSLPMLVKLF